MNSSRFLFLLICLMGACPLLLKAQTSSCPPNIDFSTGTYDHWEGKTGTVHGALGQNFVNWLSSGINPDNVKMVANGNPVTDWYGGFPMDCPYTNSFTVKLGNTIGFHEAAGFFYTYTIPPGATDFSITYYYAVVLQNPGHNEYEQPRFRAKVIDVQTGQELDCVSFDYAAQSGLPGFETGKEGVVYKPWTGVSVDLGDYAGKTIRLEFIVTDCIFEQHFGYAYLSLGPVCNGNIQGTFFCEGETFTTFSAPGGFSNYEWYANPGFSPLLSTSPTIKIETDDYQAGDIIPLVVTPHTGFGCRDTFYAIIRSGLNPVSNAGEDTVICSNSTVRLGSSKNQDYAYSWTPSYFLDDALSSQPMIVKEIDGIKQFIVKTTNLLNGCFSYDTVQVTPKLIDTSVVVAGDLLYCPGEDIQTTFLVNNQQATVQWYQSNQPLNLSQTSFQPGKTGRFWAQLKQFGCIDSTRMLDVQYAPVPAPDFKMDKAFPCINNTVIFINTTAAGTAASYTWSFSDGLTSDDPDIHRQFSQPGQYKVKLVARTGLDCTDSIEKMVSVMEICYPVLPDAFTPNGDGLNDVFKPILPGAKLKRFTVYNRWGEILFTTTKENEGWDGKIKGTMQPGGVYIWMLEFEDKSRKMQLQKGSFLLIR